MIPHVSVEDAERWASVLKANAEFILASLASGKSQKGRVLFLAFDLHLKQAAYHLVLGDKAGVREDLRRALERFSILASSEDVDPKWLRIAIEEALSVSILLKDDAHVEEALACAQRMMRVDRDGRDFFAAAEAYLYKGNRTAAAEYVALARKENDAQYSFGLMEALEGAIAGSDEEFTRGLSKALRAFDSDAASSGYGSTTAVIFIRGAGLLALHRHANPSFFDPALNDERLLFDCV